MPAPVLIAASRSVDTAEAVNELIQALSPHDPVLVVVFVGEPHDPQHVAAALAGALPGARTVGCSTAGEIGPGGYSQGGVSAFALTRPARVSVAWFDDLGGAALSGEARAVVSRMAAELGLPVDRLDPERHAFITLVDGLTSAGELFVAAVGNAAPGISLVGGSAGTGMQELGTTWTFADGAAATGSGVLLLVEPGVPFRSFATHQFETGDERLVVTGARPDQHMLDTLNGWPAVQEYARVAGVDVAALRDGSLVPAALPVQLGFRAGDQLYLRGLLEVRGDGFLLGGAVEEGMVLRTAHPVQNLVESTRMALADVMSSVGDPAGLLLFECVGRVMRAESTGQTAALSALSTPYAVAGFHTFGEQYGALQVNFTLTGIAFGVAAG
jgi:hypothetical protein